MNMMISYQELVRTFPSEIERRLNIQLERIDEKNPDGIGSHLRYRFTGRGDVLKVIQLVNGFVE